MLTFSRLGKLGALGNQLFQYCALKGISNKIDSDWKIPKTSTFYYGLLDCFELKNIKQTNFIENEKFSTIKEKSFSFDSSLFDIKDDYDLVGYFQSEKYFKHIEQEIRDDLTFKKSFGENFLRDYIFLHVRRTDYLKLPNHHPVCTKEYYEKALKYFPNDIQVRIYSDDIDWCKKNFIGDRFIICDDQEYYDGEVLNVGIQEMEKLLMPYKDLYEMSNCKGAIIANSSFSWWGAWLIKDKKFPIVSPTNWFGKSKPLNTKDLIPKEWIKI